MSRPTRVLAVGLLLTAATMASAVPAGAAGSHSPIAGSGSSWSSNAVNQWVADVQPNGLQVVFTASGSAIGRKDFANKTTDFAVTDIGYQGRDRLTGDEDTNHGRGYVYLPIVAGGTAFPYQIKVGGRLVRNLRLSGETLAKIFTNQITNWNDPAVTRDNNGKALPSKPIIPVVHSEGSGSSAQFTRYLDTVYPGIWRPFLGINGGTEYFPRKADAIAQNGSDGVMNYVASDAADGAIGYDEFSYALGKNFPVAKIENANGYFTLPTQYNVAVALTKAQINQDKNSANYLLQDLTDVYGLKDNRTYPLSSYSYMIIPTAPDDPRMTTAKRQTLSDYLYYSICEGQKEMGPIGYSPLPINLAQASFEQINTLKKADPNVDLTKRSIDTCGNPTFVAGQPTRNYLAEIAPQPPACDQAGQGPCSVTTLIIANPVRTGPNAGRAPATTPAGGTAGAAGGRGGGSTPGSGASGSGGTTGATGGGTGGQTSSTPPGAVALGGQATKKVVDPVTGQVTNVAAGGSTDAAGVPTELAAGRRPVPTALLGPLAVLLLLAALIAPPLVSRRLANPAGRSR